MYTREQYLKDSGREGWVAHRKYYAQFVNLTKKPYVEAVIRWVGKDRLLKSTDEHLNDIPLHVWDRMPVPPGSFELAKKLGSWISKGDVVCIAKEACRQYLDKEKERTVVNSDDNK